MKSPPNRRPHKQHAYAPKLMLAIATAATLSLSSTLGIAPAVAQDSITMSFVNADIRSVIETIGKATGKNFIIDPRVTGNMNIVSQTPVTKELAYEILLSTLRVHGFAAIEERGAIKIVPEADAKTSGSVMAPGAATKGDRIVTQVFALQNESAAQLATVLRPLVAQNNFIGAYPGNNTLVITDYASNVDRIRKIITAIDVPGSSDLQTIKLQYASAVDIANTIVRLLPEASANPSNPGAPAKLSVGVEPRTNSLIIRADSPALVTRIRALVSQIDTPTAANGNINVVYLKNAEATKVAETLRGLMGGASAASNAVPAANTPGGAQPNLVSSSPAPASNIQAYAATNSLIITAPDHVYNSLRSVIDKLDQRRAQVYVEALIVEVTSSVAAEFGIQWQDLTGINRSGVQAIGGTNFGGTGTNIISGAQNIGTVGQGLNIGVVRGRVTLPGIGTVLNLGALARALENDQRANVLSTPNILTLDNEEAKIVVGQNVPFVTGSFTQSNNTSTNPFQTIERKDIGLTLRVTPQVAEGGAVKLKVFQEVSSVVPTSSTVRSADLITNKRSIENTVLVDDGQTVVIGGLISDDTKNGDSRVPIIGDIPVIGNLFKYQTRSREKTNLMVFLRPLVIRDGKSAAQLSGSRYEYIRGEQANHLKEADSLLPPTGGPQLPALPALPTMPNEPKAVEKK
ncbi:MAG: type II secretion system secretin GspD [Burkholderiales bacterium]|nr:type II secretion system secretin GspD [Betaproteobacteria bacterium]